jgi:hypothetical protein
VDPLKNLSFGDQEQVRQTLERVLASPAFRNSKQCQKFLRYVVEHSHAGNDELLKERVIGVEVFGREPDYDTASDPVVRVRATEVRKRLAQYYGDSATSADVRFEMPQGSYRADIQVSAAPPSPPPESQRPQPGRRFALLAIIAGGLLTILVALFLTREVAAPTTMDQFWAPAFDSSEPALLYCGQPVVYFLSRQVHDAYRGSVPAEKQRGSYTVQLAPDASLKGSDVIPVTDQFVGIGNAHTAALLSSMFARKNKQVEIRYGNDVSFSDLRNAPSVLIGAFSNLWTLEMTGELRFVFEQDKGERRIRDRAENKTWQVAVAPDGKTPEDYAVVSRLIDSASGQLLITAAGITQYGTRAAGEFLTDPVRLQQALAKAPADWHKKNLQVLLHAAVYKGTPAQPRVLAIHAW